MVSAMKNLIKDEKSLTFVLLFAIVAYFLEHTIFSLGQSGSLIMTIVLVSVVILASIRIAHHAELLAEKVGEPYGTMILTLCAVLVEVVILAIMMSNSGSPTLARDTIYSAIMLDINGILGLAAFIGGMKYGVQEYNDDSSKSYLAMIATAVGVSMIIPEFIDDSKWKIYSVFCIFVMIMFYVLFLRLQTGVHSYFFNYSYIEKARKAGKVVPQEEVHDEEINVKKSASILVFGIVLVGFLAEIMSKTMQTGIEGTGIPLVFAGLLVAAISASPEIMTAVKAALINRMQPVINIALGATLSTVVLTVPIMEIIALIKDQPINMAMTPVQTGMVIITFLVAMMNLHDGKSNAIEGMTHFVLFATFIMLAVIGY